MLKLLRIVGVYSDIQFTNKLIILDEMLFEYCCCIINKFSLNGKIILANFFHFYNQ